MELNETIMAALAALLSALGAFAIKYVRDFLARKAVDNALWGAAGLFLEQVAKGTAEAVAREVAVNYVATRVPDSLKAQKVPTDALFDMVTSRVGLAKAGVNGTPK